LELPGEGTPWNWSQEARFLVINWLIKVPSWPIIVGRMVLIKASLNLVG